MTSRFLLLAVFLFGALGLFSQEKKVSFHFLNRENGLPTNDITGILQDKTGFIWIGTREGLCRYDGSHIKVYTTGKTDQSISTGDIKNLILLPDGDILIGTSNNLNRYSAQRDCFKQYKSIANDSNTLLSPVINFMAIAPEGKIWIIHNDGISLFDPKSEKFVRYSSKVKGKHHIDLLPTYFNWGTTNDKELIISQPNSNLHKWEKDRFIMLPIYTKEISKIVADKGDRVFLAGHKLAFFSLKEKKPELKEIVLGKSDDYKIKGIVLDEYGGLILTSTEYLVYVVDITPETSVLKNIKLSKVIQQSNIKFDYPTSIPGQGVFFSGSDQSLHLFEGKERIHRIFAFDITDQQSIKISVMNNIPIIRDNSGVNWIGSPDYGVNFFDLKKSKFNLLQNSLLDKNSIRGSMIRGIASNDEKYIWIGNSKGLNLYNREKKEFKLFKEVNFINSIEISDENLIWAGHNHLSIFEFIPETETLKKKWDFIPNVDDPEGLPGWYVTKIYTDPKKQIWVLTSGGIGRYIPDPSGKTPGKFKNYRKIENNPNSLIMNMCWDAFLDSHDNLWICTIEGLSVLNTKTETFTNYQTSESDSFSLPTNNLKVSIQDNAGSIWIGTEGGGICKFSYKDKKFYTYTTADGLPSNSIYGMIKDHAGIIWMSSKSGIIRFDPDSMIFTGYGVSDGLQAMEFNIQSSYHNKKTGEFLFGGKDGVNVFRPQDIMFSTYKPKLIISDFKLYNKRISVDTTEKNSILKKPIWETEKLDLKYNQNFIYFEFSCLHYASPENIHYKYKLEGLEKEWNRTDNSKSFANYTGLNPGKYVFRIIATNADGVWNVPEQKIFITIHPPFWGTLWFKFLVVLLLVVLALSYYKYKTASMKKRNALLERTVKERTQHILQQNEEIQQQSEELEATNEELSAQSEALKASYEELNQKSAEIEKSFKDSQIISEFGLRITSTFDLESINEIVYAYIQSIMSADAFGIGIVNPKLQQIEYIGFIELGVKIDRFVKPLNSSNSLTSWCFNNQQTVFINDFNREFSNYVDQKPNTSTKEIPQSIIHLPLSTKDRQIGIIALNSFKKNAYTKKDLINLQSFASYITIAIDNANAYKTVNAQNIKLQELDRFKEAMTGMVVHDLKNPLNAILGLSSMEPENEMMLMINSAGNQMLNLVLNILDVQKFEDTNVKLQISSHNLKEISSNSISQVNLLLKQKNLLLDNNIPEQIEVETDQELLSRVFVNLLTNSIKYTPQGGKIRLDACYAQNAQNYLLPGIEENMRILFPEDFKNIIEQNEKFVLITVTDTGQGIPTEKVHLVFEKFGQVEAKKSGSVRSTGLGMTFCKMVVEANGGKIWLHSIVGQGTIFYFLLPCIKIFELQKQPNVLDNRPVSVPEIQSIAIYSCKEGQIEKLVLNKSDLSSLYLEKTFLKVLAVDDDPYSLKIYRDYLNETTFNFYYTEIIDLDKTIYFIEELQPDLILMDWEMPKFTGIDIIKQLKKTDKVKNIPVVMVTSRSSISDLHTAFDAGAIEYIHKPIQKIEIIRRISTIAQIVKFNRPQIIWG